MEMCCQKAYIILQLLDTVNFNRYELNEEKKYFLHQVGRK